MRVKILLALVILLLLAAASTALGACANEDDAKALFKEVAAVWKAKDATTAAELYDEDATLYWNWPVSSEPPAEMTRGMEEIGILVSSGAMGYPTLYGDAVYTLDISADKPTQHISDGYRGAQFIAAPVFIGIDLYMMVLEVRDGKIQNQFVEAMYSTAVSYPLGGVPAL